MKPTTRTLQPSERTKPQFGPLRFVCSLLLAFGGLATGLSGADAQARGGSWTVSSSESAHLWFHGLATVGFEGFSLLPMYDREYVAEMRAIKEQRGVHPTRLDTQAARYRQAFESDSTFELLHFLPLYFGYASQQAVHDAIDGVARRGRVPPPGTPTAFGASVVASVLQSQQQRQVLADFVDALAEEWEVFLRDYRAETSTEREAAVVAAERRWVAEVASAVADFLSERRMSGGLVMVTSALGPEGRVFGGDPENPNDNVLAVSLALSDTGLGTSAYVLKESCFPIASDVVERLGLSLDRVNAERLSGRLAVRCGALLLDLHDADLAAEYRATFLAVASANGLPGDSFEAAFAVNDNALGMLQRAIREHTR